MAFAQMEVRIQELHEMFEILVGEHLQTARRLMIITEAWDEQLKQNNMKLKNDRRIVELLKMVTKKDRRIEELTKEVVNRNMKIKALEEALKMR
jgi:hypothetical protein